MSYCINRAVSISSDPFASLKAAAVGDEAELASAAKVLHAFRVANFEALGGDGASWFSNRGNERKAWHKAGYLKEL